MAGERRRVLPGAHAVHPLFTALIVLITVKAFTAARNTHKIATPATCALKWHQRR